MGDKRFEVIRGEIGFTGSENRNDGDDKEKWMIFEVNCCPLKFTSVK
jgi:hypothetical protein